MEMPMPSDTGARYYRVTKEFQVSQGTTGRQEGKHYAVKGQTVQMNHLMDVTGDARSAILQSQLDERTPSCGAGCHVFLFVWLAFWWGGTGYFVFGDYPGLLLEYPYLVVWMIVPLLICAVRLSSSIWGKRVAKKTMDGGRGKPYPWSGLRR